LATLRNDAFLGVDVEKIIWQIVKEVIVHFVFILRALKF
jgi:hypothetical protein